MTGVFDALWRAAAYCAHPRVLWLSVLPLVLTGLLAFGLGWLFWEDAVSAVRGRLDDWALTGSTLDWLSAVGGGGLRSMVAPLIVVALAVPGFVIVSLLIVATLMMPKLVALVATRRFAQLERRHREPLWRSVAVSTGATLLAVLALVVSMPLWLVPPLVLVLPPLIWGWLSYRVMSFDALSEHATVAERQQLMREHRVPLLVIGVVTGYLGAAPAAVWAIGALTLVLAPVLIVVSVWLYTLVFAFSALWFAHYCLAALAALRGQAALPAPAAATDRPALPAA